MASICVKEFALRRDAQHYAHLIDVDRGAGSYIDPRLGRITVAEWFERWWPTVTTLRPSTRGIRRHVLPSTTTGTSSPNTYPDMMQKTGRFRSRDVEVVRTTPTLFTFLARPNHALAAGGTVTFKMYEKHYDDGSGVYLSVSATQSVSGVESVVPSPVSKAAANMT